MLRPEKRIAPLEDTQQLPIVSYWRGVLPAPFISARVFVWNPFFQLAKRAGMATVVLQNAVSVQSTRIRCRTGTGSVLNGDLYAVLSRSWQQSKHWFSPCRSTRTKKKSCPIGRAWIRRDLCDRTGWICRWVMATKRGRLIAWLATKIAFIFMSVLLLMGKTGGGGGGQVFSVTLLDPQLFCPLFYVHLTWGCISYRDRIFLREKGRNASRTQTGRRLFCNCRGRCMHMWKTDEETGGFSALFCTSFLIQPSSLHQQNSSRKNQTRMYCRERNVCIDIILTY